MEKIGLSVDEAAEVIGIGRSELYERLATGEIESIKLGRRRLIPADALRAFMDRLLDAARAERNAKIGA